MAVTVTTWVDLTVVYVVSTELSGCGITGITLVTISMEAGGVVVMTAAHAVQVDVMV